MVTVAQVTKRFIEQRPILQEALIEGIINFANLAEKIQPRIEAELGTEVKRTDRGSYIIPVGHVPIGVRVNIMDKVEARIEAGFKNGFYLGGVAVYYF